MDPRELELIEAAKGGDNRAFDELIRRYDQRTLQIAHGIMGNMQDAYDAYQEGVIRAWSRLSSFRYESAFGTWFTRIVINQSINQKKKLRWKKRLSLEDLVGNDIVSPNRDPDDVLINTELSSQIQKSMESLSDRERVVFVLKHMHGYRLREIALMIDCAEGTVKNYLFRATQKLRSSLAGEAAAAPSFVQASET